MTGITDNKYHSTQSASLPNDGLVNALCLKSIKHIHSPYNHLITHCE